MHLAIVGASARAAAVSALGAGHAVVAADLFADTDLAAHCPVTRIDSWPDGFATWLEGQTVDGWLYTGGLENHPALLTRLASLQPLLGNREAAVRRCRSAELLANLFSTADIPFPEVRFSPPTGQGKWLLKDASSAGGLGVNDWHRPDGLGGGPVGAPRANRHPYWQRRIDGRPISAAYVAANGRAELLGITEQLIGRPWTAARPYQYAGSVGPLAVVQRTHEQITRAGSAVALQCKLTGLFGIDFVVDATEQAWALEVNPRFAASLEVIERATGRNAIAAHLEACLHGQLTRYDRSPTSNYHGKAYVFANRKVQVPRLTSPRISDIPAAGTLVSSGQPICTVHVSAPCFEEVEPALAMAVDDLRHQLIARVAE